MLEIDAKLLNNVLKRYMMLSAILITHFQAISSYLSHCYPASVNIMERLRRDTAWSHFHRRH